MCFLKGRTSDSHALEHKVFECMSYSKSLKNIFSKMAQPKDSRVMDDVREPPTIRDFHDGSTSSLHRLSYLGESPLSHIRSPSSTPEPSQRPHELRIGSRNSLINTSSPCAVRPMDHSTTTTPGMHRLSFCSTTSSDSNDGRSFEGSISPMGVLSPAIGEVGIRKQAPIISSLKKAGAGSSLHHSLQKLSHGSPVRKQPLTPTHSVSSRRYTVPEKGLSKTASEGMLLDQDEFTDLNR